MKKITGIATEEKNLFFDSALESLPDARVMIASI